MKVEKRTSYDSLNDSDLMLVWRYVNLFIEYTYLCYAEKPMYTMIRTPTINETPSVRAIKEEKFTNIILLDYKW